MVLEFIKANPDRIFIAIVAIITFLAKPRSEEQYEKIAKVSPLLAKVLLLAAAIGPDVVKAAKVIKSGKEDEK